MLQHFLGVSVRYQEGNIVALDRFPPENEERLCSLCQKSGKFMHENMLDLIGLFYPYADSDTVDTGLNENLLVFVPGNGHRIQE